MRVFWSTSVQSKLTKWAQLGVSMAMVHCWRARWRGFDAASASASSPLLKQRQSRAKVAIFAQPIWLRKASGR